MCIALPLGPSDKKKQYKLWLFIRSTPLNMLLFSAMIQIIALFFLTVLTQNNEIGSKNDFLYYVYFQFWILPFIAYALLLNFYPRLCQHGDVEYLQYAVLNTLGNINLLFFFVANLYFDGFINILLLFQLMILISAYKPIWKAGFWASKSKALLIRLINFSSLMVGISLALSLIEITFKMPTLFPYAFYLTCFQLLVIALMFPQLLKLFLINAKQ